MNRNYDTASKQKNSQKTTASSTFYNSRASSRQHFSLKKNFSTYSETANSSYSPSPDKIHTFRTQKVSLSPTKRSVYWQNWLLPESDRIHSPVHKPDTVASSMCAIFSDNNQVFMHKNSQEKRQIASLTKIMTAFTVIKICHTFGIKIRETYVRTQREASTIQGTSANLHLNDELLIIDLLYGMMLPSGNDAALSLAQYFGKFLSYNFAHENHLMHGQNQDGIGKFLELKDFYDLEYKEDSVKLFVFEMNKNAKKIGLKKTNFSNPTGLTDPNNVSTASQIATLISFCLKNHLLRSIFKKKLYVCTARNSKHATTRHIQWKNTNKHLFQFRDCIGIKTGITPGAGPCLGSAYKVLGRELIIVLLNSPTMQDRYIDAQRIFKYARSTIQGGEHLKQF